MTNLRKFFDNGSKNTQNSVKPHSQSHKKNQYDTIQDGTDLSKVYERAENKLRSKSIAERLGGTVSTLQAIRTYYPILSVLLAIGTAYLSAMYVSSDKLDFSFVGVFLSVSLIAILSEKLKILSSAEVFENQNKSFSFLLAITFVFSVALSCLGSYLITLKATSNESEIIAENTSQMDSTRINIQNQIADLDKIISSNKAILSKNVASWQINVASKSLQDAQNSKLELQKLLTSEVSNSEQKLQNRLVSDFESSNKKGLLGGLGVFFLEILFLVCYSLEFAYERKIKTENQNLGIVETPKAVEIESNVMTLQDVATALLMNQLGLLSNDNAQNKAGQNKAGFSFSTGLSNVDSNKDKHEKSALSEQEIKDSIKTELLDKALRNGVRDYRTLCSLGFNPSQVKKAIQKFNNSQK